VIAKASEALNHGARGGKAGLNKTTVGVVPETVPVDNTSSDTTMSGAVGGSHHVTASNGEAIRIEDGGSTLVRAYSVKAVASSIPADHLAYVAETDNGKGGIVDIHIALQAKVDHVVRHV
jgi:hypothetical protein